MDESNISWREKLTALWGVGMFKPTLTSVIIGASVLAATLEGVGLSFLVPIIEVASAPGDPASEADGLVAAFVTVFELFGVPFSLGFIILGLAVVMTVRYTVSFVVDWMRIALETYFVRDLQTRSFDQALNARVAYFDEHGSDDILNAIVTQSEYAGRVIKDLVKLIQESLLVAMYMAIALYLAPFLTIVACIALSSLTYIIRNVIEPGYAVGDRVAEANERIQQAVQAGTQGIRDVKLYTKEDDVYERFSSAIDLFTRTSITFGRNESAIDRFYNLAAALVVFALVYGALSFTGLSLASLGLFLFAMFRLAPRASRVNYLLYQVEGKLPHLVRTQRFIEEMERNVEPNAGGAPAPEPITPIEFDQVSFSYETEDLAEDHAERIVTDVSFTIEKNDFVAFVGQSGAGKSTLVSLLARLYESDSGQIFASGLPIEQIDINSLRERIAVVRQQPFIFNDTLRNNVMIGNESATRADVRRVCNIAQVTEFVETLPEGYETTLGDNGVRLSGGQRQRVALARALLKDADVLVLDEATSDLDTHIERRVQTGIESMDREYAIIAIAHRLSTVKNADRIYTLDDGEIAEVGTHEDLIESGGTYAQLYSK